jgi:hypothetical protein
MDSVKDFLKEQHLDIHDLLEWNASQLKNCRKKEHKVIHERYKGLLEKFKEHHLKEHYDILYPKPFLLRENKKLE